MTVAAAEAPSAVSVASGRANTLKVWQKLLLIAGLAWALTVIVPDFYRLYGSLGTLGFSADNDGVIYEVYGAPANSVVIPGESERGLKENDRIAMTPGGCSRLFKDDPGAERCRNFLAVFGGMGGLNYVWEATKVTLPIIRAGRERDPVNVELIAQRPVREPLATFFLALDELFGVVVVLMAFKLVWDRPSPMTLGFFLYAMWFNPGQYFVYYAWLQRGHPEGLLIQEGLQAVAQGAGYAGFLIFVLRFPHGRTEPQLRGIEPVAILLGVALALLQLVSFANVFGVPTEIVTDFAIYGGYTVALFALPIVAYRRKLQTPVDYQRMRWVLWGCGIGIPAFVFADGNEATSLWSHYVWSLPIWRGWTPGEAVFEVGYLCSGVLALFICTAVRRRRIVNVSYALKGVAAAAIVLIGFAILESAMHTELDDMYKSIGFPALLGFAISIAVAVTCSLVAHRLTHYADHWFNRRFYHAATHVEQLALKAKQSVSLEEIDAALVTGASNAFGLASAAVFRDMGGTFRRVSPSKGWGERDRSELNNSDDKRLVGDLARGEHVRLRLVTQDGDPGPFDLTAPAVAVPIEVTGKLFAVVMYGPHETGDDLDKLEVKSLEKLAQQAAIGYVAAKIAGLENEVRALREKLTHATGAASAA